VKNIFILGLDAFNRETLRGISDPDAYRIHGLLDYDRTEGAEDFRVAELMTQARRILDEFPDRIDAILGFLDFPVSLMQPLLCRERGLRAPSLESVLKCEHKYWSRLEQQRVIPECVPRFARFDPFAEDPLAQIDLPFPFWVKPIKSFESYLGFRIGNKREFSRAIKKIRAEVGRFAEPFNYFLECAELPEEIASAESGFCLAEQIIGGRQCTVEGWMRNSQVVVCGVADSIRFPRISSFQRYQYPSRLPRRVQERMAEYTRQVISHIGLSDTAFNVEFFWEPKTDAIRLLEINPRMAEEHADLYQKVDGRPNHQIALDLALGRDPDWLSRKGAYRAAGKFFLRRFRDGVVKRVPEPEELAQVEKIFPGTRIMIYIKKGERLSARVHQDSYSYKIGCIFLGADSQAKLLARHLEIVRRLPLEISAD